MPTVPISNALPVEFTLPASLYKLRKMNSDRPEPQSIFDCYLKDCYELPDLEVMNDWIVLLDSVLNSLYTTDGEQNFLLESYIFQMTLNYFNEDDDQASSGILEKIYTYLNGSPSCSPEVTITIHTWFGILSENKLLVECEQSYMMALLTLHKFYGDPRGRGGLGIPWELFITWRLSILSRLQGKIHDAEYIEELFDATILTFKDNPLNKFYSSHNVYQNPLKCFIQTDTPTTKYNSNPINGQGITGNKKPGNVSIFNKKLNSDKAPVFHHLSTYCKDINIPDHPFSYWTNHLYYDENNSKMDVINSTLQKSHALLKWMITHMPIFHNSGVVWETAYLRDFYLAIMQSSYSNSGGSVSSLSNYSVDRQGSKDKGGGLDSSSTPKVLNFKMDKKPQKFNRGGNLVHIFEKDSSTTSKRELNGIVYSWGQNTDGQVGTPGFQILDDEIINQRKMRVYFPKIIISLKDSIITDVASGRVHSAAITISKNVLMWGSNKTYQLGLGEKAPSQVYIPTQIPNLDDIKTVFTSIN